MDRDSLTAAPIQEPVDELETSQIVGGVYPPLLGLGRTAPASNSSKPMLPENFHHLPTKSRLRALKQYIESFQYRLNAQANFNVGKLRPLSRIMDTARTIIHAPQPIKCVEAVFVAVYLTAGLVDVERVPLGFKTELHGQVYQHIVLLVHHGGKWGAFGISRCSDLMNKDLVFNSMSSVIENFTAAYKSQGHIVLKVRVGLPIEHNVVSPNFVCWRHLNLNLRYTSWSECLSEIDKHAAKGKRLWDSWTGKSEDPTKPSSIRKASQDFKPSPSKSHCSDKLVNKKKLASRDTTPMRVKPVSPYILATAKASSSSNSHVDSSFSLCIDDSSSGSILDTHVPTTTIESSETTSTAEVSEAKKGSEATSSMVFSPAAVGNSKFWRSKPKASRCSEEVGDVVKSKKLMRTSTSLPRSTGMLVNHMLAVSRGFLKIKYFKEAPGNTGTWSNVFHGPQLSAEATAASPTPTTRGEMVMVGTTSPSFVRIPVQIHYQTLNAEALRRKQSPKLSRDG